MYKIIGADGKEYGPISIEQLGQWVTQARVNAQTRVQSAGSTEWKPAGEVPDLAALFAPPKPRPPGEGAPPILTAPKAKVQEKGLAVLSFVLGLSSFVLCLSVFTGIPAIVCGHIARRRAVRLPARYGGAALAGAGLVLGYVSIVFSLVILGLLLPALAKTKHGAQKTDCQNNLKQIGLAFKVWALEHNDQYPFNVSTNLGGSLELCVTGNDGFDRNAAAHYRIISDELGDTALLVCPDDPAKHRAANFNALQQGNLSYLLRTGTNINSENSQEIIAVCPIHGNELFSDGNVRKGSRPPR
jgi:hypothetical protein